MWLHKILQTETLSRHTRALLIKAGKAISKGNAREAKLTVELPRVKHQLDMVKCTRARKWIQLNPNDHFSDIEVIRAIVDQADQESSNLGEESLQRASEGVAAQIFESMCNV